MERIKEALDRARQQREADNREHPRKSTRQVTATQPAGLSIEYTQTRMLAPDPAAMRDAKLISDTASGDAVTDAYRMLRTRTLRAMDDHGWHSLAITSPGAGEGKTLTAINLAMSIAREVNRTVLLVDLDLRRPSVHKFFGFDIEHGISEYLADGIPLEELLINPSVERFVILPGSGRVENSSELLNSPRMRSLSAELAQRYPERIVIYDLPPVLVVDDALAFSPLVDAFLLVVEEGGTQAEEILAAYDVLSQANILGTVLNKAAESQGHYYY